MIRRSLLIVLAALTTMPLLALEPPKLQTPVAITDTTLVRAPGQMLEHATILIRDGRIDKVGTNIKLPPGTRIIDGRDKFVYPGFLDAFSRTGIETPTTDAADERRVEDVAPSISDQPHVSMPRANRHGVFARRKVEDLLDIEADTFAKQRKAGFTAALIAPPRAILGGSASVVLLDEGPLRRDVVDRQVAMTAAFAPPAARALKQRGNYPGTLLGTIAQLRQTLLDTQWYMGMLSYARRHPKQRIDLPYDPDLDQLQLVFRGSRPLVFEANTQDEIGRALNITDEFDVRAVIAGGRFAGEAVERLKASDAPVLVSLNVPNEPDKFKLDIEALRKPIAQTSVFGKAWDKRPFFPEAAYIEAKRQRDEILKNPQKLEAAGITWAFTTDGLKDASEALKRVADFVAAGLSPGAALHALTQAPAEILGVSGDLGAVRVGMLGNLTVLSAPIGEKQASATHVIIRGQVFEIPANGHGGKHGKSADEEDDDASKSGKQTAGADKKPGESTSETAGEPDPIRIHKPEWAIETDQTRRPQLHTGGSVLLENAHIITVSGDEIERGSVLIEKGKITAVGEVKRVPDNITRVDLTGYVIMPGMIDPHSHASLDAVNEWTMSVTPEVRVGDVIRHNDPVMYWAVSGGVTTMHSMHGSANTIGGQNIILKNKYGLPADKLIMPHQPRSVKFALGENVKRSGMQQGRFDPSSPRRFPGTRMGVEATMRRALSAGREYQRERKQYADAVNAEVDVPPLRRDLRLEALADVLEGKIWVNTHCYRADEILRLLQVAEDYGFRIGGLHHVLEGYRVMPEILRHGCGTATFADWWAYKIEAYNAVPQNAGMMLKYGINSAIKSDSGDLIRHMNIEASKCMKYSDLTVNEALRLVTLNPARMFGLQDRIGSIDVGKDGDIAVFDGHPLDTFSRCVLTLIEGEVYFQDAGFDPHHPAKPRPIMSFDHAGQSWKQVKGKTPQTINPIRDKKPLPPPGTPLAIVHGTVHPVSGPAIHDGIVLIRDGRIQQVGADVAVPSDAEIIDATGLHVYPGLINAATNLSMHEIGAVGVTVDTSEPGTAQPDVLAVSAVNPFSAMVEVARAEGVTTAVVVPNAPRIAGQAGAIDLDGWSMPEMLIEPRVGLVVSLPSVNPKRLLGEKPKRRRMPWETEEDKGDEKTRKQIKQIDQFFSDARLYADAVIAANKRRGVPLIERDVRFEAMIPYVRGEKPVFFRADSYKRILEALQFARRHKLRPVLVGARDAWKLGDLLAAQKVPVIYEGTFAMPARVPGLGNVSDMWNANYRALGVLAKAGVKFCVAHQGADLAKLVGTDIGRSVAFGLDPEQAVRALTLSAAEILGLDDRYGSLDAGKVANVIVTDGHPSRVTTHVRYLIIRGNMVSTESKHTRLADKFAHRPAPHLPPPRTDLKGPPSQSRR